MIYILFPGGAFGTTIEYCIRRFSKEFKIDDVNISPDGSMHNFHKKLHPVCITQLENIDPSASIVTPVYPNNSQGYTAEEIVNIFKNKILPNDKVIFIVLDNELMYEQNTLFRYYKIVLSKMMSFNNMIGVKSVQQWDPQYTCFDDMQRWEQRELLSLHPESGTNDFKLAKNCKLNDWLVLTPDEILFDLPNTIKQILNYLNLTYIDDGLDEFYNTWRHKQQYILDLHQLIEDIVINTLDKRYFKWKDLDVQSESIIQYRLKRNGFILQCYNLNKFPNDSIELFKLLTRLT